MGHCVKAASGSERGGWQGGCGELGAGRRGARLAVTRSLLREGSGRCEQEQAPPGGEHAGQNFWSQVSPRLGRRKTRWRVARAVRTGVAAEACALDWGLGSRWAALLDDETAVGKQAKVTGVTAFCLRPESPGGGQMGNWGWLHAFEMPKARIRACLGE